MNRWITLPTWSQKQILALAAKGYTNGAIAQALHCQKGTIDRHMTHMYELLDIKPHENRRAILVLEALEPTLIL